MGGHHVARGGRVVHLAVFGGAGHRQCRVETNERHFVATAEVQFLRTQGDLGSPADVALGGRRGARVWFAASRVVVKCRSLVSLRRSGIRALHVVFIGRRDRVLAHVASRVSTKATMFSSPPRARVFHAPCHISKVDLSQV